MKVLKDGDDVEWKCEITCKSCNSELEIDAADIKYMRLYSPIGSHGQACYYIICPNCKYEMVIHCYIPPHVKKKAIDGYK